MFALSPLLAADWVPWLIGLTIVSIIILVLILVAPWKSVRSEHGLDEEAETRLLLGEDPEQIDRDLAAREAERRARVSELRPRDER
jgi:hypothetical protein